MGIHWQEEKHTPVHLKKMCLFPWEMKKKKKNPRWQNKMRVFSGQIAIVNNNFLVDG